MNSTSLIHATQHPTVHVVQTNIQPAVNRFNNRLYRVNGVHDRWLATSHRATVARV